MRRIALAVILILAVLIIPNQSFAQLNTATPDMMESMGIDEKLGDYIPLEAKFATVNGDSTTLGELLQKGKPVILNPLYYECPLLCGLVIDGMINVVEDLAWQPGNEYIIISFSIDPTEDYTVASKHSKEYLSKLKTTNADKGWHFLTGNKSQIDSVVESIGFKYTKIRGTEEFAHSAAIVMLSPEGKITRYLYGIKYNEFDVRNALYESADGKVGKTLERLLMYCYTFDPNSNTYTPLAFNFMKLGGLATLIFLGIFLALLWVRDKTKKQTFNNEN
ncbi:MAG: SCO family protein [Balneolaceae bacterium]